MEPARALPRLPYPKDFYRRLQASGYEPRLGQKEFWNVVATVAKEVYLGVLPTGYGKSDAALGAYLIMREQQRVNRMLIVVPTDTQRQQYANDLLESAGRLGADLRTFKDVNDRGQTSAACLVRHEPYVWRLSLENQCEIFITTVQSVLAAGGFFYTQLMQKGRWLVFFDEYHKLSREESAQWGRAARGIEGEITIGLTATPVRSDGTRTIFDEFPVDVTVSFRQAYLENAVRGVVAHVEHYFVEMEDEEGVVRRVATEDLADFNNFDDFQIKRDLRFVSYYLTSIMTAAYSCLMTKNFKHPGQHQMLVFAMNLDHAQHVSSVLNTTFGAGFSDWVGMRRSKLENDLVLKRYTDNQLACLVQVDKATEGFNNKRASVLVFLNLLRKNTIKAIQGGGRGVRRNGAIKDFFDDVCDMFASPDTEMADLIKEFQSQTVGQDRGSSSGKDDDDPPGSSLIRKSPPIVIPPIESCISAVEFDRSEIFRVAKEDVETFRESLLHEASKTAGGRLSEPQFAQLRADFSDERLISILRAKKLEDARAAAEAIDPMPVTRARVQQAVQILASGVARMRYGRAIPKQVIGVICKQIHKRWQAEGGKAQNEANYNDLFNKIKWIDSIAKSLNASGEIPGWIAM